MLYRNDYDQERVQNSFIFLSPLPILDRSQTKKIY